jgi:GntR family transcriptional regulator
MTIDRTDPRPPFRQIADDLRDAIYSQRFRPGDRLPSARELVDRYGTAHATVRQAIAVLISDGLVLPEQGRGVFVRRRPPLVYRVEASRRILTEARAQGNQGEARLLSVDTVTPPLDVASRLNLDPETGAHVVVRRYLIVINGDPLQLANSYFDAALVTGTAIAAPENITAGRIDRELRDHLNLVPRHFLDELTTRMPTPDQRRSLRLLPGTPVIDLLRTYTDPSQRPFEVVRFIIAGDKHVLVYPGTVPAPRRRQDHAHHAIHG